jgi:mono/diheme cytochrome c family protein
VETAKENKIGFKLFNKYCSGCHPNGGNKYKAHLPLINAPQLSNFETFRAYIRNPKARDGSSTVMMSFPSKILSEQDARAIYQYIVEILRRG